MALFASSSLATPLCGTLDQSRDTYHLNLDMLFHHLSSISHRPSFQKRQTCHPALQRLIWSSHTYAMQLTKGRGLKKSPLLNDEDAICTRGPRHQADHHKGVSCQQMIPQNLRRTLCKGRRRRTRPLCTNISMR